MKTFLSTLFLFLSTVLFAQVSPIKSSYHNLTAHYNGYWIAKERIREIEKNIADNYLWNYTEVLPIYPQYDTTTSQSLQQPLEDCIEKASIAIQRHPDSRWRDNAYIMVGKARMYGSEFPEAIETYKWVNTNGDNKNDQHRALVELLRTFTEAKEYKNAVAVSDYLAKLPLSNENLRSLYLNRAYYFQKREDYNQMVQNLTKAEGLMVRGSEKARIDFIIGQVYQKLGFDANAYSYYQEALKKSNTYELSFYTRLNMAQVTQLTKNSSVKKVDKYFKKLLNDPKNTEYKDRIYYEMGDFDLKRDRLADAIDNYKKSVSASTTNKTQKSYAYLKLAQIYYENIKDFELAKNYYDSTVSSLPQDDKRYAKIKVRQEVLSEFVTYFKAIKLNDSLLVLANLPPDELDRFLEENLDQMEASDKERKEKEKKERRRSAFVSSGSELNNESLPTIHENTTGTWYFYNTAEISKGLSEFKRKWGSRTLEDNWRRSQKSGIMNASPLAQKAMTQPATVTDREPLKNQPEEEFNRENEKTRLLATLPLTQEAKDNLLSEIEQAYYHLGNLYNFKLEEKENAIQSFTSLINRFPGSAYEPEVLYQLFLLTKEIDSLQSITFANLLIDRYKESVYAKLVNNPDYREENKAINEQYRKLYERAYRLYASGDVTNSLLLIDSAMYG
ncbi:MAG: tetratricopeptide repeat protein, partial [Cyclobacteriaceae bacterium]|nr:tetratricopeptide repeat protein [Cyclobacteriaceae bacterium]